ALAEFAATLLFVFLVSASVSSPSVAYPNSDFASQQLITAMIQGFGIAAAIYFVASISGGQLNPAVTLSLWLLGRLGFVQFLLNVIAQMLGAICGASLYLACVGHGLAGTLGATMLSPQMSVGGGFLLEFLMTFFLILVVLGTVVDGDDTSSQLAPLPIGFIVLACVMLAKPYTGGSLNPARSFGPAVAASGITHDVWTHHWIYWVAPLLGSAIATFLYRVL
ncbi:major intrinsic protein, partial [Basidiobolus meristosporus CBS 931.73]